MGNEQHTATILSINTLTSLNSKVQFKIPFESLLEGYPPTPNTGRTVFAFLEQSTTENSGLLDSREVGRYLINVFQPQTFAILHDPNYQFSIVLKDNDDGVETADAHTPHTTHPNVRSLRDLALHPEAIDRTTLVDLVRQVFSRVVRVEIGALIEQRYIPLSNTSKILLMSLSLSNETLERIATEHKYIVQLDARVAGEDFNAYAVPNFQPPYLNFDLTLEDRLNCETSYDSKQVPRMIWKRNSNNDGSIFSDLDQSRLLLWAVRKYFNLDFMTRNGLLQCYFPSHDERTLKRFRKDWAAVTNIRGGFRFPLAEIRQYFGEEVALHFAWIQMYMKCLLVIITVQALLHLSVHLCDHGNRFEYEVAVTTAIVNVVGISWFSERWQAKQAQFGVTWGLDAALNGVMSQEERDLFEKDALTVDPVQPHRTMATYSPTWLAVRLIISNIVVTLAVVTALIIVNEGLHEWVFSVFRVRDRVANILNNLSQTNLFDFVNPRPLLTAILATICDSLWTRLSLILTNFENHQYEQQFEKALVRKLFLFTAFDYFVPLIYIAFFKTFWDPNGLAQNEHPFVSDEAEYSACSNLLIEQIKSVAVVNVVSLTFQSISRYSINWIRRKLNARSLKQIGEQALLDDPIVRDYYRSTEGCINQSYRNHMLSLMLTFLFGVAWKWLAVGAFVTAVVQLKSTAFQICNTERKGALMHCKDIGAWMGVTVSLVYLTIVSNIALIAFSPLNRNISTTHRAAMILLALIFSYFIRDMSRWMVRHSWNKTGKIRGLQSLMLTRAAWGAPIPQEASYSADPPLVLRTYSCSTTPSSTITFKDNRTTLPPSTASWSLVTPAPRTSGG